MENKNYLLIATGTMTGALEKVNVLTDLDTAKKVLTMMMDTTSKINYGEIIDGRQTHIGDCRAKPVYSIKREKDGSTFEKFYS